MYFNKYTLELESWGSDWVSHGNLQLKCKTMT